MAMGSLSNAGIFIDDTPGIRVNEIRSKCRRLQKEHGLGMIMIDYLQLIQGSGRIQAKTVSKKYRKFPVHLKGLAREFKVPVIAFHSFHVVLNNVRTSVR